MNEYVRTPGRKARREAVNPLEWWDEMTPRLRDRIIRESRLKYSLEQAAAAAKKEPKPWAKPACDDEPTVAQLIASGEYVTLAQASAMLGIVSRGMLSKYFPSCDRFYAIANEGDRHRVPLIPRAAVEEKVRERAERAAKKH